MDINGMPIEGYTTEGIPAAVFPGEGYPVSDTSLTALPLGLGMMLAMNERAMSGYAGLSETEKEHLIMRCKDAGSKAEMQRIVDSLVPGDSVSNIREQQEMDNVRRPNSEGGSETIF